MIVKLLTEHHLEFLSLKEDCRGWSESTLVKMSNCWKSHVSSHMRLLEDNDTVLDMVTSLPCSIHSDTSI